MKKKVLIIDDEEVIRDLVVDVLSDIGTEVVCATDGFEGLKIYEKDPSAYGLVILDVILPGMDGKEVFHKIKKLNEEAKILIISGFTKNEIMDELFSYGIVGYLPKPFSILSLTEKISEIL